jgi:hypothetical protein
MSKLLTLIVVTSGLVGAPTLAEACGRGHYEIRNVVSKEWVPPRCERVPTRTWSPGAFYNCYQTVVIRPAHTVYDACGRPRNIPALTRQVVVTRQRPGTYKTTWASRTIPGYYRHVNRQQRVFVSDCRCHRGSRLVIRAPTSTRSLQRDTRRSGRKVEREFGRAGSRVAKELGRLFR